MVVEGFLAVTGQTLIRDYMLEHSMYPGFGEGFGLVERDEHRHVAFGVRFLRDAIRDDARHRETVERVVLELAPKAAYVFAPPYVSDASEYVSYGYTSRQIYGFAYRTLKRRMKVLGIEIPPADEFMPGPIDGTTELAAVPAVAQAPLVVPARRTAQAISRRRPRASRPKRRAGEQQPEADRGQRDELEAGLGQGAARPATGLAGGYVLGGRVFLGGRLLPVRLLLGLLLLAFGRRGGLVLGRLRGRHALRSDGRRLGGRRGDSGRCRSPAAAVLGRRRSGQDHERE
jgi:hypothetical protein